MGQTAAGTDRTPGRESSPSAPAAPAPGAAGPPCPPAGAPPCGPRPAPGAAGDAGATRHVLSVRSIGIALLITVLTGPGVPGRPTSIGGLPYTGVARGRHRPYT